MKLQEAEQLAKDLMKKNNLTDWDFGFDFSISRFGVCYWKRKRITLSRTLVELNSIEQVTNTILHEIAHALAPLGAGHGRIWKRIAISIGDDGGRTYNENLVKTPPKKYIAICPNGHTALRRKKGKISCGKCSPRFNKAYLFKYKINPDYK